MHARAQNVRAADIRKSAGEREMGQGRDAKRHLRRLRRGLDQYNLPIGPGSLTSSFLSVSRLLARRSKEELTMKPPQRSGRARTTTSDPDGVVSISTPPWRLVGVCSAVCSL